MSELFMLPIFPLRIVVFPTEALNLHIFEPRYKQLVRECFESGAHFGIPTAMNGKVMPIGTAVKVCSIDRVHEGGEMDIRTEGVHIFEVENMYEKAKDKLYGVAQVRQIPFNTVAKSVDFAQKIAISLTELYDLTKIGKKYPCDLAKLHSYQYAHYAGLSLEQEYQLLTILNETDRQIFILNHLESLLPSVREIENLRNRAHMNGHFKRL